jgi:hypothetical protein
VLEGDGWTVSRPGRFTSGKDPVPIVQEAGWAPRPVWTCAKNLAPTGIFLYHSWPFSTFRPFWPLVVQVTNMGQIILLPLRKEVMLWIFPAGKIRRLRSGANPRSWVPEASMLTPRSPKPLPGFDPRTVQPVVSLYTDWATRPIRVYDMIWYTYILPQLGWHPVAAVHHTFTRKQYTYTQTARIIQR